MCGIAGILSTKKVNVETISAMTDSIRHRGPDGEGQWLNAAKNIGLGHRRLSIIDLSQNGAQPMHYANNRYTITFNGEIYNYKELKVMLEGQGYTFRSNSDTEILLALYDLKKEKCLNQLDGMFAFAIWDEKEQSLFCARDRFGEKPFYFHFDGTSFSFASEMKALWAAGVEKKANAQAVELFVNENRQMSSVFPGKTFYTGIEQLLPAEYCILQLRSGVINITKSKYWAISDYVFAGTTIKFEDAIDKIRELLKRSIRDRLAADVSVGSSLSGGVDSSIIVSTILNQNKQLNPFHTFTARFTGFEKDESSFVDLFLKGKSRISAHAVYPQEEEFYQVFEKICYHQEEPFFSTSIFAQWKVMELAQKHNITVLLDGQGADELFGGYLPYYRHHLYDLFLKGDPSYKAELKVYNEMHNTKLSDFSNQETLRMKVGRIRGRLTNKKETVSNFKGALVRDLSSSNLQSLLRYADRNSMAFSRELRLPFLSKDLTEFVIGLPDEYLLKDGWTKYILRSAFEDTVNSEIIWKKNKIGFEAPPIKKYNEFDSVLKETRHFLKQNINTNINQIDDWKLLCLSPFIK